MACRWNLRTRRPAAPLIIKPKIRTRGLDDATDKKCREHLEKMKAFAKNIKDATLRNFYSRKWEQILKKLNRKTFFKSLEHFHSHVNEIFEKRVKPVQGIYESVYGQLPPRTSQFLKAKPTTAPAQHEMDVSAAGQFYTAVQDITDSIVPVQSKAYRNNQPHCLNGALQCNALHPLTKGKLSDMKAPKMPDLLIAGKNKRLTKVHTKRISEQLGRVPEGMQREITRKVHHLECHKITKTDGVTLYVEGCDNDTQNILKKDTKEACDLFKNGKPRGIKFQKSSKTDDTQLRFNRTTTSVRVLTRAHNLSDTSDEEDVVAPPKKIKMT